MQEIFGVGCRLSAVGYQMLPSAIDFRGRFSNFEKSLLNDE
jgi:hypothetical protein